MLRYFVFLFSVTYVVTSDNDRNVKWTKINNVTIETNIMEYCNNKNCLIKCCPPGEYLKGKPNTTFTQCGPFTRPNKVIAERLKDLSEFNKYSWNFSGIETSKPYFDLIQNDFYTNDVNQTVSWPHCKFNILQDGSLNSSCPQIDKQPALKFCVDFRITGKSISDANLLLVFKVPTDPNDPDMVVKQLYIAAGMLISSFFMLLVLFVYAVLPSLWNIGGLVLMAYLVSIISGFSMKAVQLIYLYISNFTVEECENTIEADVVFSLLSAVCLLLLPLVICDNAILEASLSKNIKEEEMWLASGPAVYYFILASFFWLNIMSFDLWWTIRGSYKQRPIHRQGERVKFIWYSLYAWGVPALMTLLFVIIERMKLITNNKYKPPFSSCFAEVDPSRLYVHLPIGIMTILNCIMFAMTALNIWKIKSGLSNAAESNNTKKNENRFLIYIKLSVLMGISWVLELLPNMPLIPHIIVNFFTIFIGVGIFYVFVCKKSTIKLLCKRFNISNDYLDGLQTSQYSTSGRSAPSTKRFSTKNGRMSQKRFDEGTELSTITSS